MLNGKFCWVNQFPLSKIVTENTALSFLRPPLVLIYSSSNHRYSQAFMGCVAVKIDKKKVELGKMYAIAARRKEGAE